MRRKFVGQKLNEEEDFQDPLVSLERISSTIINNHRSSKITTADVPKGKILSASFYNPAFIKFGFYEGKEKLNKNDRRRVVSCMPNFLTNDLDLSTPPNLPQVDLLNNLETKNRNHSKKGLRVTSMCDPGSSSIFQQDVLKKPFSPSHMRKSSSVYSEDFLKQQNPVYGNRSQTLRQSSESLKLLNQILDNYSDMGEKTPLTPELTEIPDLTAVPELNYSSSSPSSSVQDAEGWFEDTNSETFSFNEKDEEKLNRIDLKSIEDQKRRARNYKPLPDIPVKRLSQASFRNYSNSPTTNKVNLMNHGIPKLTHSKKAENTPKEINYRKVVDKSLIKKEVDKNIDFSKFTRKCSMNNRSQHTNSSGSSPVSSISSSFKDLSSANSLTSSFSASSTSSVSTNDSPTLFLPKNKVKKTNQKRDLTPIEETPFRIKQEPFMLPGYEANHTTLRVVNRSIS